MCGGTPKVEKRDIQAEKRLADMEATSKANADIAARRAGRRRSSLISNYGGAGGVSAISTPAGSDTLG